MSELSEERCSNCGHGFEERCVVCDRTFGCGSCSIACGHCDQRCLPTSDEARRFDREGFPREPGFRGVPLGEAS